MLLHTLAGEAVGTEQCLGAVTLLAFYKTECPTCALAFPYWQRMHHAYPGLRLLTIAQNTADEVLDFAGQTDLELLLDDEPYAASKAMGILYTPTVFLLDTEGAVASKVEAWDREAYVALGADIARRLGADPVALFDDAPARQFG